MAVEKLSRDAEWAAKFFVHALSRPPKNFPQNIVFLPGFSSGAPLVINNDQSLSNNNDELIFINIIIFIVI